MRPTGRPKRAGGRYPRIGCSVLGCGRGTATVEPGTCIICGPHWRMTPLSTRRRWKAIKAEYARLDREFETLDQGEHSEAWVKFTRRAIRAARMGDRCWRLLVRQATQASAGI